MRDLQLRPSSKFAYLLRPLPARAEQLNDYATDFRRRILRVVNLSRARKRYGPLARLLVVPYIGTRWSAQLPLRP